MFSSNGCGSLGLQPFFWGWFWDRLRVVLKNLQWNDRGLNILLRPQQFQIQQPKRTANELRASRAVPPGLSLVSGVTEFEVAINQQILERWKKYDRSIPR
jgi:hypothetical protein